jgi:hypothetical protein
MAEITNADRAAWAEEAVEAFQAVCATDDDNAIPDLIVDLCHLARRRRAEQGDADFDAAGFLHARAMMHDMEVAEDPED